MGVGSMSWIRRVARGLARTPSVLVSATIVLAGLGAPALHAEDCPAGTTDIARFANSSGKWIQATGTPGIVTLINPTDTGGQFTSLAAIR